MVIRGEDTFTVADETRQIILANICFEHIFSIPFGRRSLTLYYGLTGGQSYYIVRQ